MNWHQRYAADRPRKMIDVNTTPPVTTPKGRTCDHVSCIRTLEDNQGVTRINFDDPKKPVGVNPAYVHSGCVGNFLSGLSGVDIPHLTLQTGLGIKDADTDTPRTLHEIQQSHY